MNHEGHLKLKVFQQGPHLHVVIFGGPDKDHLAFCGGLVMREPEWSTLACALNGACDDGLVEIVWGKTRDGFTSNEEIAGQNRI